MIYSEDKNGKCPICKRSFCIEDQSFNYNYGSIEATQEDIVIYCDSCLVEERIFDTDIEENGELEYKGKTFKFYEGIKSLFIVVDGVVIHEVSNIDAEDESIREIMDSYLKGLK